MVVDLTATDKYYKRKSIEEEGIEYVKIFTPGHVVNNSPSLKNLNNFIEVINTFRGKSPEKYIGVHCTHGHNRTGNNNNIQQVYIQFTT